MPSSQDKGKEYDTTAAKEETQPLLGDGELGRPSKYGSMENTESKAPPLPQGQTELGAHEQYGANYVTAGLRSMANTNVTNLKNAGAAITSASSVVASDASLSEKAQAASWGFLKAAGNLAKVAASVAGAPIHFAATQIEEVGWATRVMEPIIEQFAEKHFGMQEFEEGQDYVIELPGQRASGTYQVIGRTEQGHVVAILENNGKPTFTALHPVEISQKIAEEFSKLEEPQKTAAIARGEKLHFSGDVGDRVFLRFDNTLSKAVTSVQILSEKRTLSFNKETKRVVATAPAETSQSHSSAPSTSHTRTRR